MKNKIFLIDANLLLFRSFYAAYAVNKNNLGNLPAHFFFNTIFEILNIYGPTHILFSFDAFGPTKRHEIFNEYKSGRIRPPQELYNQKEIIINILEAMDLKHFSKVGDEADDIIATAANKFKEDNLIYIFSEDKDLLQLVDKNVCVIHKNKNKSSNNKYEIVDIDNFYDLYQYNPWQTPDYKGIAGDTSDNLIGIKGIGPKTTIELLSKYKTLENIFNHLNELTEKQQHLFNEYKTQSLLCKQLATLNSNVDIAINMNNIEININNFLDKKVEDILTLYNLNKIKQIISKYKK